MEKDKSPNKIGGSLLPPSGRYSLFSSPPGIGINVKPEHSTGLTLPPLGPGATSESSLFSHGMSPDSSLFSHDISRMTDNPMKKSGHRRAHSEILTLPDDISFDSDLGVVGGLDGPSLSDEAEDDLLSMYLDMDFNSMSATSSMELGGPSSSAPSDSTPPPAENPAPLSSERPRVRHQHSQSLDGSTSIKQLMGSGTEETSADARKATSAAKLSELAITDPKRAKRVWANRQSAARSKERKMRYISELERKVQAMQTEATSLSAQLALLQRDTNGLTAENSELKLHLQTMEQQVNLQDALNESLREEMQHLKMMTSQAIQNGGPMNFLSSSYGANQQQQQQQFYNNNHAAMQSLLTAQQFQQLQINQQSQQQQHQFQQQQQQQQFQQQQHSQQQLAEMKMRGSVGSQRENGSDANTSSNE